MTAAADACLSRPVIFEQVYICKQLNGIVE